MPDYFWNDNDDGVITAQIGPYRLTVATIGGMPRFLIRVDDGAGGKWSGVLLASGTGETLAGAMRATKACVRSPRRSAIHGLPRAMCRPGRCAR